MNDIRQAWQRHAEPFTDVVSAVRDWDASSPCAGWTARDVVTHVTQTQSQFLAEHGHHLPAPKAGDPASCWHEHSGAVARLLGDPAVAEQEYDGAFGPSTVGEALARFYAFDLLVHRWDIARSQGADERFGEAELDEIDAAIDGFGDHAYAPGVFAAPPDTPDGADRQARLLARTGRRA